MDPATWAWIGVIVGSIGPAVAVRRSRGVASDTGMVPRSTPLAVVAFLAAIAITGSVMLDGWWPWGAVYLVAGAIVVGIAAWVGQRCSTAVQIRAAAALTRRGDRGGAIAARDGATVVAFAVVGVALVGVSLAYLALDHWIEVDDPAAVLAGLALGAVALALVLRMTEVPVTTGGRRAGSSVDLATYTVLAPIAATTLGLASGIEIDAAAAMFPLGAMVIGAAASLGAGLTVRHGNPVSVLRRRGYLGALGTAISAVALALVMFDTAEFARPIGLGLAAAAGVGLAPVLGLIGELFTSDQWRPVKRIATRSKSGPGPVVLAGIGDATRACSLMLVAVAAVMVAAYRAGEFATSGGGRYGMALAAVGVASTLGFSAAGVVFAPIARAAGDLGASPTEVQSEAAEAVAAAGSASGAVSSVVIVGAGIATAFALLLGLSSVAGSGTTDLGDGGVLLGFVVGAAIPLFAAGAAAGTWSRTEDGGMWTEILRLLVPVSVGVAVPIALGVTDVAVLRGFVTGAVGVGLGVAGFLVVAGGAWDNARRVVETGAYGGPGSRAHRALVTADSIGEPLREIAGPAIVTLLALIAAAAAAFAGAF